MTNKELIKKINNINWYRQGGALKLFYCFGPYHCVNETIGYNKNIIYQEGDMNTAFFDRDSETREANYIIDKQKKNKKLIDDWIRDWRKKTLKTLNYCQKEFRKPIDKWTNKELVNFLFKFNKLWLESWNKGVFLEWTDPDGLNILKAAIKKYEIKLNPQELELLLSPEKLTFIQKEFISRIEIAIHKKQGLDISKEIEKHVQNFHWYKNTWAYVYELNRNYFVKLIKEDLKDLSVRQKQVKQIQNLIGNLKKKKNNAYKKHKIPRELKNLFYMFSHMTDWRDERKEIGVCVPNYYLYQILKKIMKENKIPENLAGMLVYTEVKGWKLSKKLINTLKERSKNALYFCTAHKKCHWLYGKKAKEIFNILVESIGRRDLKGTIASKGVAVGKVKIIETKADFSKMQKGNILLTTMTRPEFVPLMKMAGAIVTNEGGITCHAAVISRELNKPCIIGTQVATEVLKDGDMIEVDANKGVVKILKRLRK